MYWQNNQGGLSSQGQQCHGVGGEAGSPFSADSGGAGGAGGAPFRSPLHRPRYQSSPRYHPQFGSPFPDPYRVAPGGVRPQRSPRHSPRHEYNHPLQGSNMDSPYHGNNRRMSNHDNGRGRGRKHYHSGSRDFSSPGSTYSDRNPGSSDDITQYYSPDMVQDPWANLQPVSQTNKT